MGRHTDPDGRQADPGPPDPMIVSINLRMMVTEVLCGVGAVVGGFVAAVEDGFILYGLLAVIAGLAIGAGAVWWFANSLR
jgi:hypothetical protein